ncbi:hypothetical protein MKX03_017819 [Papaver bracteatum]|nr:hypothetical protein MKX03_017819 [Papaver bracteatum]
MDYSSLGSLNHGGGVDIFKIYQRYFGAPAVQPSGIRVRLSNLPRKKNIQRDLQSAFKGFVGIVSVSPAVSGSKKTREPICKGFVFVYFTSKEAANRCSSKK